VVTWQFIPIERFQEHAVTWRDLNVRSAKTPLLDPRFVLPLIESFGVGDELLGLSGPLERPHAMGIFRRTNRFAWQTFQPANAPLGAWLCEADQSPGDVLASLCGSLPGQSLLVGLTQLDPDIHPRPDSQGRLRTVDYIKTARIEIEGSFDDYWNSRSKNLRHNMKRQTNRLKRDGIDVRFETLSAPQDMCRAVADYGALEQSGWKAEMDTAVRADQAQGQFYKSMLSTFAADGQAAVYRYFYGESLVASDICIEGDDCMIVLKTAHDHSLKGTSPAQLMRFEIFRQAFDSGKIRRIEFYGPVMDWHLRWTEEVRTIYHLNYYRWPWVASLHERQRRSQ
jgi:CelD/BcsL family acetyltransferase involved in cellulose biosynthesis